MKPGHPFDFRVHVRPESLEHNETVADHFDGIYLVVLNHVIWVHIVPAFPREPWPPVLPKNMDVVASKEEARRMSVGAGQYVITADEARAGTLESVPMELVDPAGPSGDIVVWYITAGEMEPLSNELSELSERFPGVHDTLAVSEIAKTQLAELLLSRIVKSPPMRKEDMHTLGR